MYSGFLYLLQVLWFPLPSTGTPVSSTFYRYSRFLYLLQVLWFPLPSTGTPVSSTFYRYSGFLYLLQVLLLPLPSTEYLKKVEETGVPVEGRGNRSTCRR
jgi:hypothetical protein